MRTLQVANTEYFKTAAILGEKVAQIKSLEAEVDKLAEDVRELFSEIQIHKAAAAAQAEQAEQSYLKSVKNPDNTGSPPPAPAIAPVPQSNA